MVAPNVPRLDYQPRLCIARPMLFGALEAYERGDYIAAGCKLREAVKRFVVAACEWYGVTPLKGKFPRPADYARALHKAGQLDEWGLECIFEMIDVGNKLAHCQAVDVNSLRGGISILFAMMDGEPYAGHERNPVATSYKPEGYDCDDCDDDDSADFWKGGAV